MSSTNIVICPVCGSENLLGIRYCEFCNEPLEQSRPVMPAQVTPPAIVQPVAIPQNSTPVENLAAFDTFPTTPPAIQSGGSAGVATLIVTMGVTPGEQFELSPKVNTYEIGRLDEDEGFYPHIDLDKQDNEGFVHRRHAVIRLAGNEWVLEDVGGANGTRVRRAGQVQRVASQSKWVLRAGDELIIGRVYLRFETV